MANLDASINPAELKVLVVDDIPLNIMLIGKMLSLHGIKIQKAGNGVEALKMIEADRPHLVLIDLIMPEMTGYEVIEKVRTTLSKEELPMIVLSALNSNDDIVKAMKLGANDFITKPVLAERLYNSVFTNINNLLAAK